MFYSGVIGPKVEFVIASDGLMAVPGIRPNITLPLLPADYVVMSQLGDDREAAEAICDDDDGNNKRQSKRVPQQLN